MWIRYSVWRAQQFFVVAPYMQLLQVQSFPFCRFPNMASQNTDNLTIFSLKINNFFISVCLEILFKVRPFRLLLNCQVSWIRNGSKKLWSSLDWDPQHANITCCIGILTKSIGYGGGWVQPAEIHAVLMCNYWNQCISWGEAITELARNENIVSFSSSLLSSSYQCCVWHFTHPHSFPLQKFGWMLK